MSELLLSDGAITAESGEPVRGAVHCSAPVLLNTQGVNLPLAGAVILHLALLALALTVHRLGDRPTRSPEVYPIRLYSAAEVTPTVSNARPAPVALPASRPHVAMSARAEIPPPATPFPAQVQGPPVNVAGPVAAASAPISAPPAPVVTAVALPPLPAGGNSGSMVVSGATGSLPVETVTGNGADSATVRGVGGLATPTPAAPSLVLAHPLYRQNPEPEYPPQARRRGVEGTVVLEAQISLEGTVGGLAVHQSSGHPLLDEAALKAVKTWRFVPGRRGAEQVAMPVLVPVRFGLR